MPVRYTKAQWKWFDSRRVDPLNAEQIGLVSQLLHTNRSRILDAIGKVGNRAGDIRQWLAENPPKKRR